MAAMGRKNRHQGSSQSDGLGKSTKVYGRRKGPGYRYYFSAEERETFKRQIEANDRIENFELPGIPPETFSYRHTPAKGSRGIGLWKILTVY